MSHTPDESVQRVKNWMQHVVDQASHAPPSGYSYNGAVVYYGGPEDLKYCFTVLGYDYIISVKPGTYTPNRVIQNEPIHHPTDVRVEVVSIGDNAPLIQSSIRELIEYYTEYNAIEDTYMIRVISGTSNQMRVGGLDKLWISTHTIRHEDG